MPYYHACVIIHRIDEGVAYDLARIFENFEIKAVGFEEIPKPHFHVLFKSPERICYRYIRVNGVYIRFIPVKSRRHYFNLVRYIHSHKKSEGGGIVKKEEFVRFVVESLKELRERVERIEKELENTKTATATKETTQKVDSVEVNLSRINIRLSPARKGVMMRIRFAKYIKVNKNNEAYVILTEDDLKALRNMFNTIKFTTTEGKAKKNGKVEVTTADDVFEE